MEIPLKYSRHGIKTVNPHFYFPPIIFNNYLVIKKESKNKTSSNLTNFQIRYRKRYSIFLKSRLPSDCITISLVTRSYN